MVEESVRKGDATDNLIGKVEDVQREMIHELFLHIDQDGERRHILFRKHVTLCADLALTRSTTLF